ncbi:MAG: hypothetical protein HQL96_12860 [Magnetococcales bacterium]|nr:hypothetical protein [Magnetococcales bacterium]
MQIFLQLIRSLFALPGRLFFFSGALHAPVPVVVPVRSRRRQRVTGREF